MPILDRAIQKKVNARVLELLKQPGLTTKAISERTGATTRQVLRLKKKLEEQRAAGTTG